MKREQEDALHSVSRLSRIAFRCHCFATTFIAIYRNQHEQSLHAFRLPTIGAATMLTAAVSCAQEPNIRVNSPAQMVIVTLSPHPISDTSFTHDIARKALAAIAKAVIRRGDARSHAEIIQANHHQI